MKIQLPTREVLNRPDPQAWEVTPTEQLLADVRGLGRLKLESLVEKASDGSELVELAKTDRLGLVVGRVVAERIKERLAEVGADLHPTKKTVQRQTKEAMRFDTVKVLADRGYSLKDSLVEFEYAGVSWAVDFLMQTPGGESVAVVVKRSLDRCSYFEAFATLLAVMNAGLADEAMVVSNRREKAYQTSFGDFQLVFLDEER